MTTTNEDREALISEGEPLAGLPGCLRWALGVGAAVVLAVCGWLMWDYVQDPRQSASPQDLQLGNVMIAALAILVLAVVPWQKLGLRIRKIGAIEFDRVVSTQANEYAEEFSEQRTRIVELEKMVHALDDTSETSKYFAAQNLRPLVIEFLNAFQPTAYSPRRIREWGARQRGFERLKDYEQGMIRRILQDLVAEGRLATRVSRLGNTLYKVID